MTSHSKYQSGTRGFEKRLNTSLNPGNRSEHNRKGSHGVSEVLQRLSLKRGTSQM
jgi:hypothetical protein